ncbi:chemotaxis protein [Alteribacillus sp. HJP-4]|uniref:chemotaxis protein n=1 Tax=Alteribacillus sp. HJP-4 TaxID=2775394 RepID=UPI0035CD1E06
MSVTNQTDILLDSGTNELEIVMFMVGTGTFGINVLKVREIIQPVEITETPNRHSHMKGIIRLRKEVIPVIDLAEVLEYQAPEQTGQDKFIIGELNKMKVAFHVHSVSRIHRISWEQIEKPGELSRGHQAHTIGIVKLEQRMALLLDYEKIVMDIAPQAGIDKQALTQLPSKDRSIKSIYIAEDSPVLRKLLEDTLCEAGYTSLHIFEDGKEAWQALQSKAAEEEIIDLLITDIEMPKMDGHHLTVRIKEDPVLKHLPVVIFSSLISEDLYHKGSKVGADAQVSKPEILELVQELDKLLFE